MSAVANVDARARWSEYILYSGDDVPAFWLRRFTPDARGVLLVAGRGFDPRMCDCLRMLIEAGFGKGGRVRMVAYDEGRDSPSHERDDMANANWVEFQELCSAASIPVEEERLVMWSGDDRLRGPTAALDVFQQASEILGFSDVIIDISALPRALYFPLIAKLLYLADEAASSAAVVNVHVVVSEQPILDKSIRDEGVEDAAYYMPAFLGEADMQSIADQPLIWIPLLGPAQGVQLRRVHELVGPQQIAPMLPSPAVNPRTADELLLEYRSFLFDELQVEPRSFVHASELNPFEVYRQLRGMILHYRQALAPLGGTRTVVSVHSTKLMSVGALLAAYELKTTGIRVGIADVAAHGYTLAFVEKERTATGRLFSLWLAGECYGK